MLEFIKKSFKKSSLIWMLMFSYIFSVFIIIGIQLKKTGMTQCGLRGKGLILIQAIPLAILIGIFVYLIAIITDYGKERAFDGRAVGSIKLYLLSTISIFLLYFPVFLAYYPAIMAYDFHRQSQEAMAGFQYFWPYQPIIHTWLYWLFFKIGGMFGLLETGMALYSIFQMIIMSLVLGYATVMVYRLTHKRWCYILALLFWGLFPFFSVMVVEATKDVIFSALFVLFLLLLVEREMFTHEKKWVIDLGWILTSVLLTQFRKNAIYAIVLFLILYFVWKSNTKRLRKLLLSLIMLVACQFVSFMMPRVIGTEMKEPQIEKYSVIVQSFARVLYFHSDEMDPGLRMEIEEFIPMERWSQYNPTISDPVKASLGDWDDKLPELLSLWIKTGLEYPNEYLDSILLTNAGYLFFDDVTWCEILGVGLDSRMGAINTENSTVSELIPEGIIHHSKLPGLEAWLEKIVSANSFYKLPILNVLFRPAFYVWLALLGAYVLLVTGQRKKVIFFIFPIAYFMTLLLGPVVFWRYIYPIALFMPVLICIWFAGKMD